MKITVFRYNPQEEDEPYYETYEIKETEPHMKILDALNYINEKYGANIAFRSSCRAGQCGSCAILANKRPLLACRADVEDGMVLEPLKNMSVIRDLVTSSEGTYKKIRGLRSYLHRGTEKVDGFEKIGLRVNNKLDKVKSCIECFSCMSGCPVVSRSKEFAGPTLMRLISKFALDPRDRLNRLPIAIEEGLYMCTTCGLCKEVCPQDIPSNKSVEDLREEVFRNYECIKKIKEGSKQPK